MTEHGDSHRWRRLLRWGLLIGTAAFLAWTLDRQWEEVRLSARPLAVQWGWIGAATLLVLATYALLIQAWRMLLAEWGGVLSYPVAIRIWTIANLGRWIPGKIWSVGALGLLARDQGVSGWAASGAALLGTALNIGAGFAMAVLVGTSALDHLRPGLRPTVILLTVVFLLVVAVLPRLLPRFLDAVARRRGLESVSWLLPARTLWAVTAMHALSWIGYGVAFGWFARGITPAISGNPSLFIAVFSVSYLIGYLALFAPGGLGVREYAVVGLLVGLGAAGKGDAVVLGATSRVWLTVLELLPGLVSLLLLPPAQRRSLRTPS